MVREKLRYRKEFIFMILSEVYHNKLEKHFKLIAKRE